jgi:hypothetical protein
LGGVFVDSVWVFESAFSGFDPSVFDEGFLHGCEISKKSCQEAGAGLIVRGGPWNLRKSARCLYCPCGPVLPEAFGESGCGQYGPPEFLDLLHGSGTVLSWFDKVAVALDSSELAGPVKMLPMIARKLDLDIGFTGAFLWWNFPSNPSHLSGAGSAPLLGCQPGKACLLKVAVKAGFKVLPKGPVELWLVRLLFKCWHVGKMLLYLFPWQSMRPSPYGYMFHRS